MVRSLVSINLFFSDKMGYFYLELRIKIGTNLEVVPDTDLG